MTEAHEQNGQTCEQEHKKSCGSWEFSFKETEDGFTINIKGDKERLRAKREAIEAFKEFQSKAKKAGFYPPFLHFFAQYDRDRR
ncbi:hypothetical protein H1S01_06860 [Heliobacterium chlorum]|uniref:Uncharacterized protein n=1 Tax=Heliobacterium chlorum TaxID=2698 RepID=A0ABR7T0B0_HELCL|nr:hypothetical protein [Heliobacterium chlorum]MBC9784229.1 hypothetical protein [Heliobacterium chlorum]